MKNCNFLKNGHNIPNASNAQLGRRGNSGLQLQRTHAKRKALYQAISEHRKRNDGAEIDFQEILDELHEQKFYENVEDSRQIKRIWKEDVYVSIIFTTFTNFKALFYNEPITVNYIEQPTTKQKNQP